MVVRLLSDTIINRIAAGEVIERPASVVKELVENAIDACATSIIVKVERGGKNLIIVSDDGIGMNLDDLMLCVERHTTSKLDEADINDIRYFGFRGEALPSIGSVSKLTITAKHINDDKAYSIYIEGGIKHKPIEAAHNKGTKVEVRDLFFATPARLKFLKSDQVEFEAIQDIIRKLAIAHPSIKFKLISNDKVVLEAKEEAFENRITELLSNKFIQNAARVNYKSEDLEITGYVSLPTFNKSNALEQFLFVNSRPIKDKVLSTSIKISYQDFFSYRKASFCFTIHYCSTS